jgi:UDP-glucose:(heptosyl)LPS alpha-1,3-glucosyltransferase
MAETVERERDSAGRQRLAGPRRLGNALAYRLIAPAERYVARRGAGRVVAVSGALARAIERHNGPLGARLAVVPNGVDPAEFSPEVRADRLRTRRALDLPAEAGVVLFVGYNWERKGLATLVEALARLGQRGELPPPYLVAVGGRGQPAYERRVLERLGGRARFLGERTDLPALYGAADVCALPSLEEPFGLPILEAMACGLPTVVSRRAGVSELISDRVDGFILEDPRDAGALARLLGDLLGSAERRAEVGSRARRTAERYAWGEVARRTEPVYLDALRAREPARAEAR